MSTSDNLSSIFNPDRLLAAFKLHFPWPREQPPSPDVVANLLFGSDPSRTEQFRTVCYDSLKVLSEIGLKNIPQNLLQYLPAPESPQFPEQAYGMIILLDQAPRALLQGIDGRYTNDYFDVLALRLSKQLMSLPEDQRIDGKTRWIEQLGYSWSHWIALRFWFIAPFAHSESMADQDIQTAAMQETRLEIETQTGKKDSYAKKRGEVMSDPIWFSRLALGGLPEDLNGQFYYWFCLLMDAHPPIIKEFGRYPYRNGAVGRESTEEELEFSKRTGGFAEVDEETAKKIREDVLKGAWTPLGEN